MSDKDFSKNPITINSICTEITFSGQGVITFLNNLLISDLHILQRKTYSYTALCNLKGRIICSMWINVIDENTIHLLCPTDMKEFVLSFFNMRKFRLKIDIQESSNNVIFDASKHKLTTSQNSNDHEYKENIEPYFDYLLSQNLPWIDSHNSEKFIPQHVNLDRKEHVMSFTKGCYPGQEIIARMKFLGKIKKRMTIFKHEDKLKLLNNINGLTQVSPIYFLSSSNQYQVQVIDKLTNSK